MLILCGLLSRQIVVKVCTCYLSLCSIFLSHNILFVAPCLLLPLFHFQFLLFRYPFDSQRIVSSSLIIIIIIIIIIINYHISVGIYNYIPDTKHVTRKCSVADIL